MKRSELRRGKPLKRGKFSTGTRAPKRHARIPKVNRKRQDSEWKRRFLSKAFVRFTKASPSSVSGEVSFRTDEKGELVGLNVCSHSAKSRGAGGTWEDIVPLTKAEHDEEHRVGVKTFWESRGKDPLVEAAEHRARWLAYSNNNG